MQFELYAYYLSPRTRRIYCPQCVAEHNLSGLVKGRNSSEQEMYCTLCDGPIAYVGQTYNVRSDYRNLQDEL